MDLVWEMPVPVPLIHRRMKVCMVLPLVIRPTDTLVLRFRRES